MRWTNGQRRWVLCCLETWSRWSQPGGSTLSLLLSESVQPSSSWNPESIGLSLHPCRDLPHSPASASAWTTRRPERGTHYKEGVSSPWWGASISFPLLLACPGQALPLLTKASQPLGPLKIPEPQSGSSPRSKRNEIHFYLQFEKVKIACFTFSKSNNPER